MAIWESDPKRSRRRPDDDYDQTWLDITLLIVMLGAIGLIVYVAGPLVWLLLHRR